MADSHRNDDERSCGGKTIVSGQDFVKINGELWAVENDEDDHGDGQLISGNSWLTINGKGVIVVGDDAQEDDLCPIEGGDHCAPKASSGDGAVTVT